MTATISDIIHIIYDARNRSDKPAIESILHPDIAFRIVGHPTLGYMTSAVRGKHATLGTVGRLIEEWDLSGLDYTVHAQAGDKVAIHRRGTIRHRASGRTFVSEIVDLLTFRDGLVVEFVEFLDTASLIETARGQEPA